MMYIERTLIEEFFLGLNAASIQYVLIKNIGRELPDRLKDGKDIDILIHPDSGPAFVRVMQEMDFQRMPPPLGVQAGWSFGYKLSEYQFWSKQGTAQHFYIDAFEKLACKSLSPKMWIPIDAFVNDSIWRNRVFDKKNQWWCMDEENLAAYLLIRCVFDKHIFKKEYIAEIEKREALFQEETVICKLQTVFFSYTPRLLALVREKRYHEIFSDYIAFDEY